MSSVNPRMRGSFVSAVQDLVLAIPSHQVTAAIHPEKHTKSLTVKRKGSRRVLERHLNDQLSRRGRH